MSTRVLEFNDLDSCASQCSSCGACRDCGLCETLCPVGAITRHHLAAPGHEDVLGQHHALAQVLDGHLDDDVAAFLA